MAVVVVQPGAGSRGKHAERHGEGQHCPPAHPPAAGQSPQQRQKRGVRHKAVPGKQAGPPHRIRQKQHGCLKRGRDRLPDPQPPAHRIPFRGFQHPGGRQRGKQQQHVKPAPVTALGPQQKCAVQRRRKGGQQAQKEQPPQPVSLFDPKAVNHRQNQPAHGQPQRAGGPLVFHQHVRAVHTRGRKQHTAHQIQQFVF